MMKVFLIVIAGVLLITSCRSTRKIQTAMAKKDSTNVAPVHKGEDSAAVIRESVAGLKSHHVDFTTFSAKIDVDYVGGDGKKENANANVRMYKDSAIWISV